ncbi:hypothetical protein ETAA8_28420 [Anatilimnocola aggregata]|uniref:Uncharacterized protein n=1 Tax=Anatilimnocola aggregata TaxID=2528021 RepID=A0A517YC95_9BACT|nr:hypothetical protein ETAA8_28420 [Anatilimnocola aggregata]
MRAIAYPHPCRVAVGVPSTFGGGVPSFALPVVVLGLGSRCPVLVLISKPHEPLAAWAVHLIASADKLRVVVMLAGRVLGCLCCGLSGLPVGV